jgi:hypothetical protein
MLVTQRDRTAIARSQKLGLAAVAALPDRPHRVNHVARRQPIALGDLGLARLAAMEHAAFHDEVRPRGAVDRAIDAATAEQRRIRGVDDGVNAELGDVGDDDLETGRADGADRIAQAEAAAPTGTPLSVNSCCSSPLWNISRMMSQPPTNSPFT